MTRHIECPWCEGWFLVEFDGDDVFDEDEEFNYLETNCTICHKPIRLGIEQHISYGITTIEKGGIMKEAKFTPGPWRLTRNDEWIVGRDDKIGEVLIASRGLQSTANANLIAAAPEMYEMLEGILGHICYDSRLCAICDNYNERIEQLLKKARGEV